MKKIISLVLVLVMVATLFAGCGKDGGKDDADGKVKLGLIGPLTGGAAVYGTAVKNGAQLAVDEINAKNGDIQFVLNAQDDENDAEKSSNAYNNLVDWGMDILVGTVTTTPCITVSSLAYEDRIFTLTPSASSTQVTEGKDNVYQICFNDPNQGTASARYIAENFPEAKVAIIYDNGSAYSSGIYQTFAAEAETLGMNIVSVSTCTEETSDFSVQVGDAKNAGADLVFLPIYYTPASLILNHANSIGYEPTFFGVDGMDGILTLDGFDTSLAEGVMLLTPFAADAEDAATQAFVESYKSAYGEVPNQFAADAYDCVYAIYNAYSLSGLSVEASTEEICNAMMDAFNTMSFSGLTGANMTWKNGQVDKAPAAVVIENGVYVAAN